MNNKSSQQSNLLADPPNADSGSALSHEPQPAPTRSWSPWWRRLTLALIAAYFVLGAMLLLVRDVIWPDLGRWQSNVELLLSKYTGQEVHITGLAGEFSGFSPVVRAESIRIARRGGDELFSASQISAALNWRTLVRWTPVLEFLSSRKMSVRIERISDTHLAIAGRQFALPDLSGFDIATPRSELKRWQLPEWLMAEQGFRLDEVDVEYRDSKLGTAFIASGVTVQSHERDGQRSLMMDIPRLSGQNGSVQLRATLGKTSPTSMTEQSLGKVRWHGDAWIKITDFDSGQVAALMRQPLVLQHGEFSGQAWFSLVDSAPANARLILSGADVGLLAEQSTAEFRSLGAQIDAVWANNGNVKLTVSKAQATDVDGNQLTVDDSSHTATLNTAFQPVQARFSLRAFDAKRFHQFAMRLPIPTDMRNQFARLSLSGKVASLQMEYDASNGPTRYIIDATFERLGIGYDLDKNRVAPKQWAPRLPSAENISGNVIVTEKQGKARIFGNKAAISFPGVFTQPRIPFDTLSADVSWQVRPDRLPVNANGTGRPDVVVQVRNLAFSNADSEGEVNASFQTAAKGPGIIDLSGKLVRADASRVYRYLPMKIPGKVRDWVQESFVAGKSQDVRFVLKGDLRDFPFREPGSGEFVIDAKVNDGRFRYAPDWPVIDNMQARVKIIRGGLDVSSPSARIYGVGLKETKAVIADFRNSVLKIDGIAVGSAQEMVRYVNNSPIGKRIDGFTTNTRISGKATTRLSLSLPLKNFDDFRLEGASTLNKANVLLTDFLPPFSGVTGTLLFSETGIAIEKMTGSVLGGKASVTARSPQRGQTEVLISGHSSAAGLRKFGNNLLTRSVKGSTNYQASIRVNRGVPTIVVTSALEGLALEMPPPLYKRAEVSLPMTVEMSPIGKTNNGVSADQLSVSVPEGRVSIVLQRKRNDKGQMRITRGVLAVGAETAPVLPQDGLRVSVTGTSVNADRWIDFWSADQQVMTKAQRRSEPLTGGAPRSGYFAGFDLIPSEVTLLAPSARFLNKRYHDVVLGATRVKQQWRMNLSSREANGYLSYAGNANTAKALLSARFSQLNIPESEVSSFERMISESRFSLPAMDVQAEQFTLQGRPMGRLSLQAVNRQSQWLISELSLQHPSARFAASGRWWVGDTSPRGNTRLNFDLDVQDAGALLTDLGMPKTLSGGLGKIGGILQWGGTPFAPDLATLGGELSIALGRGQFLKTEPGMAKLVGVLSLQALPRRLSLDVTDLFQNGFAFDAIVGQAEINKGVVKTDSLLMHGVQAEVLIAGTADMASETQDLSVKVGPHINAGIASLAYAALANPAIGLGTLLAQIILDKPLKEIFGHEFLVTGPWSAPNVAEVNRFEEDLDDTNSAYSPG
ncbi:MAG: YhdP family protein [Burkholderiaceae bacterium]